MNDTTKQKDAAYILEYLQKLGFETELTLKAEIFTIRIKGNTNLIDISHISSLPHVLKVSDISKKYKLTSREWKPEDTVIKVGQHTIGGGTLTIMAGPCSVESEHQIMTTARAVKKSGAQILRGGAFKPRTGPYDFQGLKEEGLKLLKLASEETGLPIVTELMHIRHTDLVCKYTDIIQIGARNMQNYDLLSECGKLDKPIFLKRGMSAKLEEFLLAAEYILSGGNPHVILCERGIRTFENSTRNTLDLNSAALAKQLSHLPVIIDPSHGTGRRDLILPLSRAAVALGSDGLMIEVHPKPEEALSDGDQSLTLEQFDELMQNITTLHSLIQS